MHKQQVYRACIWLSRPNQFVHAISEPKSEKSKLAGIGDLDDNWSFVEKKNLAKVM